MKTQQLCLVIGDPIQHSLSPLIHNIGYKALHIENEFYFEAQQVPLNSLKDFFQQLRNQNIRGVSVTIPHKVEVMKYLDIVDDAARKIGAVNTIVHEGGMLCGYNTDWMGIVQPLKKRTDLFHKKVVILGAGGGARAAIYAMMQAKAEVVIMNRTESHAQRLAEEFNCATVPWKDRKGVITSDIIINTTPVGMFPHSNESPISRDSIRGKHILFDIIYNPFRTQLIQDAYIVGATVIHGTEMFIYQAAEQFRLYTGKDAPVEVMQEILLQHLLDTI